MGPVFYKEPIVSTILERWFADLNEVWVEFYTKHGGGGGDFYAMRSYTDWETLLAKSTAKTVFLVTRRRQLPLRGEVNDAFTEKLLALVPDGEWVTVSSPLVFPKYADYLISDNIRQVVRAELEALRGREVWAGPDFSFPDSYWEPNFEADVLIVVRESAASTADLERAKATLPL